VNADGVGQGRAVANTLLGMGSVAVVLATIAYSRGTELRFIDATGMAGFGVLMLATGLLQHWQVRPRSSAS
jgi:hypothetical protein